MPIPNHALYLGAFLLLGGCGAEVAGTAATVGALQAKQAQQAQAHQRDAEKRLGESLQAVGAAASAAARE